MKTPIALGITLAAIAFASSLALSQVTIPEMAELQAKYGEKVKLDVLRPHELAVGDLNAKFTSALERAQETAQKSGKLEEAFAIKTEKEAVLAGNYTPAADDAKTAAGLKTLRATYRTALAKLELDRDKKLRPLKDVFAKSLEMVIDALTKNGKLEEAMVAKKMREELLASTGGAAAIGSSKAASMNVDGKMFVNSLGMKFVAIPGTKVLMCIHETRYKDYAAYAAEAPGVNEAWRNQTHDGFVITDGAEHPVVYVSWDDAQAFCNWLSKKEGKPYRLPTDQEWSYAVGIGKAEKTSNDTTPEMLQQKVPNEFPWGSMWPPPNNTGNFSDASRKDKAPRVDAQYIDGGYFDGFPTTSPVMSFKPNKLGLYDLGGNIWEWCDDWYNAAKTQRVLRGGSWDGRGLAGLLSSGRAYGAPTDRHINRGFRCVIMMTP